MSEIRIKRAYEAPDADDGYRILVDRLWPRGLTKAKACLGIWLKEVGPSTELRKWFGHDPALFADFSTRYKAELESNEAFAELRNIVRQHPRVTLVYAAKDDSHNNAVVLQQLLASDDEGN